LTTTLTTVYHNSSFQRNSEYVDRNFRLKQAHLLALRLPYPLSAHLNLNQNDNK